MYSKYHIASDSAIIWPGLCLKMSVSSYLRLIPVHNQCKLDEELDYDNDIERDLEEIAQYIIDWELNLRGPLGLTREEVHRINQEGDPILKQ